MQSVVFLPSVILRTAPSSSTFETIVRLVPQDLQNLLGPLSVPHLGQNIETSRETWSAKRSLLVKVNHRWHFPSEKIKPCQCYWHPPARYKTVLIIPSDSGNFDILVYNSAIRGGSFDEAPNTSSTTCFGVGFRRDRTGAKQ